MRPGFAPAKVNLTLHITGRQSDGYHLLDSLVAFADVGDVLTVGAGDGLVVTGPFAVGVPTDETNLIRRALALTGECRSVILDKRLPHPAGLGGGSSDAAAVLRLVGASVPSRDLLELGADVPVCAVAQASRMRGIGDVVEPVPIPALHAVLVNPGLSSPTPAVFRALAAPENAPMGELPDWPHATALIDWLSTCRNDLEPAALAVAPGIAEVLEALRETDAGLVRMSGSGATCFGLYTDAISAQRAASALARPGWWVRACVLS